MCLLSVTARDSRKPPHQSRRGGGAGSEVDHSTSAGEYLEGSLVVHVIYYKTYYLQFELFPGLGPTQEWTGEAVVVVGDEDQRC